MKLTGRRISQRHMCADLLKLVWADEAGHRRKEMVVLEDISSGGACIQIDHSIPVGTPVSLLYPKGRYYGRIRHCSFLRTGFFAGIEFDPGYEWTKESYTPSHLLEVRFSEPSGRKKAGREATAKPSKTVKTSA